MIKYEYNSFLNEKIKEIAETLGMSHVKIDRVVCVKSYGSSARRTIARCHGLSRIMQKALRTKAVYVIEVISEKFDKLNEEEKIKILIHELMHIPKAFGGGFKHHNYVTERNVDKLYKQYNGLAHRQ